MTITGTHFNYYQVCHRKLWLFANGISMEHTSELVYEGKLIHEESYPQRASRYEEVAIEGIKVDYYDARNHIIHEVKKSNKVERAHELQLKYYMFVFEQHGIKDVRGILEYPTLHKTTEIVLSNVDRETIEDMKADIQRIIEQDECPPKTRKTICRNCSYFEFCYAGEPAEGEQEKDHTL